MPPESSDLGDGRDTVGDSRLAPTKGTNGHLVLVHSNPCVDSEVLVDSGLCKVWRR